MDRENLHVLAFRFEGEPTRRALDEILTFFRMRLCDESERGASV
jgi:hypothetical protein